MLDAEDATHASTKGPSTLLQKVTLLCILLQLITSFREHWVLCVRQALGCWEFTSEWQNPLMDCASSGSTKETTKMQYSRGRVIEGTCARVSLLLQGLHLGSTLGTM